MARKPNTNTSGNAFQSSKVDNVWAKATTVRGWNAATDRRDRCGAHIKYAHYGDTTKTTGWEIDHIKPVSKKGSDDLSNLQPLQWENNRSKGDNYPSYPSTYCKVKS